MPWWPADKWKRMTGGTECPMCEDAHLPVNPHSELIAELSASYARLHVNQTQPGYTVVISKRHAAELHDLEPEELCGFWSDVAAVGRALTALFRPVKIDNLVMGHLCPHVHCHVYPQYESNDPKALEHINVQRGDVGLSADEWRTRVDAIRQELRVGPTADPRPAAP